MTVSSVAVPAGTIIHRCEAASVSNERVERCSRLRAVLFDALARFRIEPDHAMAAAQRRSVMLAPMRPSPIMASSIVTRNARCSWAALPTMFALLVDRERRRRICESTHRHRDEFFAFERVVDDCAAGGQS